MTKQILQSLLLAAGAGVILSLAGCATRVTLSSSSPPVQGSVAVGNGGNNQCISGTSEYVTFANGNSGFTPVPSTALNCTIQLTNSSGYYYKTTEYAAAVNECMAPYSFICMTPTNSNAYSVHFNSSQALAFTISFTGNPPPPGSKVYLLMSWH